MYAARWLPCVATAATVPATETFAVADDAQPRVDDEENNGVVVNAAVLGV